jgi:hypothetical protein
VVSPLSLKVTSTGTPSEISVRRPTYVKPLVTVLAPSVSLLTEKLLVSPVKRAITFLEPAVSGSPHSAKKLVPSAKDREDVFTAQLSGVVFMTVIPVADPSKVTERLEDEFSVNTS